VLAGGGRNLLGGELKDGHYVHPTIFQGHNKMRIFQEEIFGPVVAVTTSKDEAEALAIANDTLYGLGAGVWSRDGDTAYRMGRGLQAGRVWTNCHHAYPAHAAFGGCRQSGIGRETHKMMLDHYQQAKNLLVSYSENKLGLFQAGGRTAPARPAAVPGRRVPRRAGGHPWPSSPASPPPPRRSSSSSGCGPVTAPSCSTSLAAAATGAPPCASRTASSGWGARTGCSARSAAAPSG
jgi:hypothetical protein